MQIVDVQLFRIPPEYRRLSEIVDILSRASLVCILQMGGELDEYELTDEEMEAARSVLASQGAEDHEHLLIRAAMVLARNRAVSALEELRTERPDWMGKYREADLNGLMTALASTEPLEWWDEWGLLDGIAGLAEQELRRVEVPVEPDDPIFGGKS